MRPAFLWCRPKDEFSKGKEWRLYDYVTRHFIASLMDDAEYDETPGSPIHAVPSLEHQAVNDIDLRSKPKGSRA